jgi:hypothetical protein
MTYQPVWGPARLVSAAQNKRYARVRLGKLSSLVIWQAVPGWIASTIVRLAVPATLSTRPDWDRQLRNDVLKVKARRLL